MTRTSKQERRGLVLALVSVVVGPALLIAQYLAAIFMAFATSDTPVLGPASFVVVVTVLGAAAFALPVGAFVTAVKATKNSGRTPISMWAVVVSSFVLVLLLAGQVFLIASALGLCGLDGCG